MANRRQGKGSDGKGKAPVSKVTRREKFEELDRATQGDGGL